MRDEIIIGKADGLCGATAIGREGGIPTKCYISENSKSYWIDECFLDASMRIAKDTPEGKKIEELLKRKEYKKIDNFLDKIVLKHLTASKLKNLINNAVKESFLEGKKAAQKEMRITLGLEE